MSEKPANQNPLPVHQCKNCGHEISRQDMDAAAIISGVVQCPECEHTGPLNVVMRKPNQKKSPQRSARKR